MTSQALSQGMRARADAVITADRRETKYLIESARAARLLRIFGEQLTRHRFTGEGANLLPDPHHFVTTVYFDTAEREHFRAACEDAEHNVKVRAREYYDLHPALAELATSVSQIVRYQPWVWFEVKRRAAGRSQKRRFRLAKSEVQAFLRGEHAAFERDDRAQADGDLADIVAHCRAQSAPLLPSAIVHYRRIAFQNESATLRITVDSEIGFYRPPADLWSRTQALVRGTFGAPAGVEHGVLVEVKQSGESPTWLVQALSALSAEPITYSKFVRAGHLL